MIKPVPSLEKGKIKISLYDVGVRMLSEVHYVPKLRKNLTSLGNLQANGYSFHSDGDKDMMSISKDAMTMMRAGRVAGNIYKLLGSTVMDDVASIETDNDATNCGKCAWVI